MSSCCWGRCCTGVRWRKVLSITGKPWCRTAPHGITFFPPRNPCHIGCSPTSPPRAGARGCPDLDTATATTPRSSRPQTAFICATSFRSTMSTAFRQPCWRWTTTTALWPTSTARKSHGQMRGSRERCSPGMPFWTGGTKRCFMQVERPIWWTSTPVCWCRAPMCWPWRFTTTASRVQTSRRGPSCFWVRLTQATPSAHHRRGFRPLQRIRILSRST